MCIRDRSTPPAISKVAETCRSVCKCAFGRLLRFINLWNQDVRLSGRITSPLLEVNTLSVFFHWSPSKSFCLYCSIFHCFKSVIISCGIFIALLDCLDFGVSSKIPCSGVYRMALVMCTRFLSKSISDQFKPHNSPLRIPVYITSIIAVLYSNGSLSKQLIRLSSCNSSSTGASLYSTWGGLTRLQGFDGITCHCTAVVSIDDKIRWYFTIVVSARVLLLLTGWNISFLLSAAESLFTVSFETFRPS